MTAAFERIAVLGLGLLGGSVALAARRAGVAPVITGATRRPEVLALAAARGIVDEPGSFEQAVVGADLVVLSTPIFAMPTVLEKVAPHLASGAIVTDVGSVKGPVLDTLTGLLPAGVVFVGSHPMAGSHEQGLGVARADLFDGAACIVTDADDERAAGRVAAFWQALGCRVLRLSAADHDEKVAWVSHVPHVLAWAFAGALADAPEGTDALVGPGFRDFTRIARSSPEMWGEILTANRKALASPIQAVAEVLAELARAIEANDTEKVERLIGVARESLSLASPTSSDLEDET